jgi:outer membrane receptor protein involved in Fe transport
VEESGLFPCASGGQVFKLDVSFTSRCDPSFTMFFPITRSLGLQRPAPYFSKTLLTVAACAACCSGALAQPVATLPAVDVVGSMPLPGLGQPRDEIAAPVQTANQQDMKDSGALDLSDFMNRRLGSVHVTETQGNPYQMDVNYRGYTASPLLGTPQGLSVYVDGMRINQPFGDVVSWDLIPRSAISSITLMPGSNPIFGLNTLGGALSVQTKDGRRDPGTSLQTTVGSYGRSAIEFEHGGVNEQGLSAYVNANLFRDDGWRKSSGSDVRQLFSKFGWQNAKTDVAVSLAHADNELNGNGLQEMSQLERDRSSVYTAPDVTKNRATQLNLVASHAFSDDVVFSGNLYYRDIHTNSINADINEGSLDQSVYQPSAADRAALAAAGYTGYPTSGASAANTPFPYWRCIAQALQNDEPGEKCNGLINRSQTDQRNYGFSGQLSLASELASSRNQLVLGMGYDASRVSFGQLTQLGYLNPDHTVTGVNAYADGTRGGTVDVMGVITPYDTEVDLLGHIRTWSVYASDTLSLKDNLHLTVSGRYNTTTVENRDQLQRHAGSAASLSSDNTFARLNPSIGLTYSPTESLNIYTGYGESSRAPTAIELGCANPDQPCKLPNAMAGDPPLKQVVTRTVELGVRGKVGAAMQWNAGIFTAENQDDILFVADNQAGFGYFKNFGQTRRQGLELGLSDALTKLRWGTQYTWLNATYQSSETVGGTGNSSNDATAPGLDGNIIIRPGDRLPLVPQHMLKVFADYAATPALTLHGSMVAVSGALARGNENNGHSPDGRVFQGPGETAGYAIFNLGADYNLAQKWTLGAQINNLFDTRYNTAAQLGANGFSANGNFAARSLSAVGGAYPVPQSTFYAPGAPRMLAVSLRYVFR